MQIKLTDEQIKNLTQHLGCTIEEAHKYINEADKIELIAQKLDDKTDDDAMWDIFNSLDGYKVAKKQLGKGKNSNKAFEVEFYADELFQDWEQIEDDDEVKELLKDEPEIQKLIQELNEGE